MNKKNIKQHSKRGTIAHYTSLINKMICMKEFNSARLMIDKLLPDYHNDSRLRKLQAKLYMNLGLFDEAIDALENIDLDYTFKILTALYLKKDDDKQLYPIYLKYYKENINDIHLITLSESRKIMSYYTMRLCLLKRYGDLKKEEIDISNLTYTDLLMYDYNEEMVLRHINNGHKNKEEVTRTQFNDDIDIEKLYHKVREFIGENLDKSIINDNMVDSYIIYYPNCGVDTTKHVCNHIMVKSFINTDNIVTIYPIVPVYAKNVLYLNKEENKNYSSNKIKIKTGIERFKNKYNNY